MAVGNLPENSPVQQRMDEQARINKHGAKCKICKHEDRALIEEDYLTGARLSEIARRWKVERYSLERHVRFFRLQERRDYSSRRMCHALLDRVDLSRVRVDNNLLLGVLKLNAQINGELAPQAIKHSGTVDVSHHMDELAHNLIKKIGGLPDGVSLDELKGEDNDPQ